jgi:tRNA (guanine-N7-)-methyltransferase
MTEDDIAGEAERPLRSYGRRKGKRLSPRKTRLTEEMLPRLRLALNTPAPRDLRAVFPVQVGDVWLEIGFGSGEHLLWQSAHHPDVGLIGCEPFINGVASLLGGIEDYGLKTVRVHDGDAREVLAWLPDASIGRAFILFPDPWPKKRHAKRRLVSPALVADLARVIRSGGILRFASDDMGYAGEALLSVLQKETFAWQADTAADWRVRPEDWPETRYERKALSEGRNPVYLTWQRR